MPKAYQELDQIQKNLEAHFRDMQDMSLPFKKADFGCCNAVLANERVWQL